MDKFEDGIGSPKKSTKQNNLFSPQVQNGKKQPFLSKLKKSGLSLLLKLLKIIDFLEVFMSIYLQ